MSRTISLVVSLGLLTVIYWQVDLQGLSKVLQQCDLGWLVISLSMVLPLTVVTAWRLRQLLPTGLVLAFREVLGLVLAASTLNMVLPSKMGDIAKAYFMRQRGHLDGTLALSLVIFEKSCDMLALLWWCMLGLMVYPDKGMLYWVMTVVVVLLLVLLAMVVGSLRFTRILLGALAWALPGLAGAKVRKVEGSWAVMHRFFWQDRTRVLRIAATSLVLWFLHLLQVWMFIRALRVATVPLSTNLALAPLAILAGLLPLTFAGVGTRDAAIILFYRPYLEAHVGAALGLLCTSRYLLPALGGWPFLSRYLPAVRRQEARTEGQ